MPVSSIICISLFNVAKLSTLIFSDSKKSNKPWTVYGITSFGDGCGKKNKFGIYTKLTNYVDFIWSIVNCNGICESNNNTL